MFLPTCNRLRYDGRMGRTPRDQAGEARGSLTAPGSMHLGLRLSKHRADQLKTIVANANERAVAAGLPGSYTASALVANVIHTWLDAETAKIETAAKRKR